MEKEKETSKKKKSGGGNPKPMLSRSRSLQSMKGAYLLAKKSAAPNNNGNATTSAPHTSATTTPISPAPAVATPTTEARGKKKRSATTKEKKKVQKKKDKDKDKDSVHQNVDATATTEPPELKTSSPTSPRRKKGFGRSPDIQANNALPRAHSLQVFSGSISAPEDDDDPLLQPRHSTSGGGSLKSKVPVSRPSVVPSLTDLSPSKSASPRTPSATALVSPRNSPRHQQYLPPPPQKPPPLELPAFSAANSGPSLSQTKQQTSPTTPPTVVPGSPTSSPRCSPRSPPSSALGSSSTSSPRSPHSRSAHASDSHIKRVPPSPKSRSDESVRGGAATTTTSTDNNDQEVDLVFLPSISAQALPPPLSLASLDILPPPSSVPPPSSASHLSTQGGTGGGTGSPRSSSPSLSTPLSSVSSSIPPSSPISFSPSSVATKSPRERGVSLPPVLIRNNSSDVYHSPPLSHSLPHSSSSSSLTPSSSIPPSSPSKRDRKEKREKKEHRKKDRSHSLNVTSLSSSSSSGERSSKRKGSGSSASPTGSPSPLVCSRTLRRGSKSEIHKEALPSSLLSSSPPSFPSSLSCSALSSSSCAPSASSLSSSTNSSPPHTPTLSNSSSESTTVAEERTITEEEHSEQEASSKLSSSTSSLPSLSPSSSPPTSSLSTSGSSISTTAAASTANIPDKRERTRKEAINEIVNTERDYVRDMQLVIQVFLAPLKEKQLMEPQKLSTIFSNVELLVGVNEEMLKSFDRTAHKDQEEMIGDTFLSVMHYFKMYTVYCSNQPLALKTLAEMKQTNRPFVQFLQECIDNPACRGLDLFSYLIKPVQRICKYPLLLRTLLEVTQETHKDYRNLKKAEEDMEKLVQYVNEGNREAENRQKILELQNSIDGGDTLGLVQPTRRYLMEESLDVCKNGKRSKSKDLQRRCVLFNDMLLLLKVRKEGYIAPVQIDLSNEHIKLFDVGDTEKIKNAFDLKDVKRKKMFTFCFPSAQMKSQWLKAIKSIINTHQMKRFMQAEEQAQHEKVEREQFQLLQQQHNSVTFGAAESNAARAVGFAVSDLKDANSVLKQSSSSSALSSSAISSQPENSSSSVEIPDTSNKIPAAVTVNKRAKFQRSMSLNSMQNMKIENTKKASTTPTGGEEQPQQPPTPSSSTKRTPRAQYSQDEIAAAASSSGKHSSVNNKQTGEKKARVLSPRQESSPSMFAPTSPRNKSTPLSPRERNSCNSKERCERRDSKEERKRANKTKDSASKVKEQDQEKKYDKLVDEAVGEGDKPEEVEARVEEPREEEGKPGEALTDQDPILVNAS
ncbi:RhoGEF domain containing protein [Balamuthia mandrillaris]